MSPFELLIKLSPIQYGWWDEEKQKVITWKDPEFNQPGYFEKHLHILKPAEVWQHKCGTCWDTTLLIYDELIRMKYKDVDAFWFESKSASSSAMSTHTSVLFQDPTSKKYFWFEYSWFQHKGLHGPFDSKAQFFSILKKDYILPTGEKLVFLNESFDAKFLLSLDIIRAEDFVKIARGYR